MKVGDKVLTTKPQKVEPAKVEKAKPKARKRNPTKRGYAAKTFERLFQAIANGATLAEACAVPGMPTVWTARRRFQTDDLLNDQYLKALRIKIHALTDDLPDLADKALEGKGEPTRAEKLQAAKLKSDNVKWLAQRLLNEYAGDGEGGNVVLNITNAPDIPAVSQPASSPPTPLFKIVNGGGSSGSDEGQ
ncbi:hypothetical protein PQR05_03935 [Paraburkholderia sediminicola]|uniref:terminase small subunit-like protein n=1 Tax=Paraburkholderia sediminicola TaxID=458836 RepID=UPI0038BD3845